MSGLNNELKQEFRATKLQVENSPLLSHLRYLALKDYHIELYKVLKKSPSNKDNIFNLLEKRVLSNPKNKLEVEKALQDGSVALIVFYTFFISFSDCMKS